MDVKSANKYWKSKIAVRFLLTYTLLLIIPFSAAIMTTVRIRYTIIDMSVEHAQNALEQTANVVSSYLTHAVKTVSIVSMDESLVLITSSASMERNKVYYHTISLMNSLNSFRITNGFYADMFLVLGGYGFVVTTNTIYRTDRFYGTFFNYGDLDETSWNILMTQSNKGTFLPATTIYHDQSAYRVIPYVCALQPTSRGEETDYIILMLDESKVAALLHSIDIGDNGYVYVVDWNGQMITSVRGSNTDEVTPIDFSVPNPVYDDMIVTSHVSGNNGWRYVAVVPKDYVLRDVSSQFRQTLLLLCFALLVGLFCSLLFTTMNMRPIREVVGAIKATLKPGNAQMQNEYELIKSHVHQITNRNSDLQSKLDVLQPIMQSTVFESILNGTDFHDKDINEALTYIDLNLSGLMYTVAIIKITYSPEEFQSFDRAIVSVGEIVAQGSIYLHYSDDKIVLLYADTPGMNLKQRADILAHEAVRTAKERYDIDILFGFSDIHGDASSLNKAYKEALQVIYYLYMGRTVVWYHELPRNSSIYYFPANMKASLTNAAHNGNFDEAERVIRKLYYENFVSRKLTPQMYRQLLSEFYSVACSVTQNNVDYLANLIMPPIEKNIEDSFDDIILLFEKICRESSERRLRYKSDLINKIVTYLETEYTNEAVSLTSVADCFGLSETYLSHLFKDETGDNFSKYIENKRIQLALTMIGKKKIKDIAKEVGYANVMTFSRAFRRVKGCNPSKYGSARR